MRHAADRYLGSISWNGTSGPARRATAKLVVCSQHPWRENVRIRDREENRSFFDVLSLSTPAHPGSVVDRDGYCFRRRSVSPGGHVRGRSAARGRGDGAHATLRRRGAAAAALRVCRLRDGFCLTMFPRRGPIAQLAEQLTLNPTLSRAIGEVGQRVTKSIRDLVCCLVCQLGSAA